MEPVPVPAPETFTLRVYDPQGPSNYFVAPFQRINTTLHTLDLAALGPGAIGVGAVYQVYPGRAGHCFYDPLPPGARWYCMARVGPVGPQWQQLVVIDAHDQYAYFVIPAGATELRWIRANSQTELKNSLL